MYITVLRRSVCSLWHVLHKAMNHGYENDFSVKVLLGVKQKKAEVAVPIAGKGHCTREGWCGGCQLTENLSLW